jgi:hypothetical protein
MERQEVVWNLAVADWKALLARVFSERSLVVQVGRRC